MTAESDQKPTCFVSYSMREPHVPVLLDCINIVLGSHYDLKMTPSALGSGASQREQIAALIENCAFAIVILDGLRPNVVFEFGMIQAKARPLILFREAEAEVDIHGLFSSPPAELKIVAPRVNLDTQLSNAKDINYAEWNRFSVKATLGVIYSEYTKKSDEIRGYRTIEKPPLHK